MIPLFTKIRKKMADDNKPMKYFRYAFGEIILVVIGILIALSINTWNIERLKEKEAHNELIEVHQEIFNNIIVFHNAGEIYHEKLRSISRFFSDTLVYEDYINERKLTYIMTNSPSFLTQDEAYNNLIQNADNLPNKYKSLIVDLKNLYNLSSLEETNRSLKKRQSEAIDLIEPFGASLFKNDQSDLIQFVMTNKDYRNKLVTYSYYCDDIAPGLVRKKYQAIELYRKMVALGFPDRNMAQIIKMDNNINYNIVQPFIGSYTNTRDTLIISYTNNEFLLFQNRSEEGIKLTVSDSSTLQFQGHYMKYNMEKSMFYDYANVKKPLYQRIQN